MGRCKIGKLMQLYIELQRMSKKGNKDKKSDNNQNLEVQIEEQKRQILQQSFTIKQLQDRISRMTEQNYEIVATQDQTQKKYEDKIHSQQICLESHQSTIEKLSSKNQRLEVIKMELESTINSLQKQEVRVREMEEYKKLVGSEMGVLENQLKQYTTYMKERDQLFAEKNKLKNELSTEKEEKARELADKEREKVQETDKLKDEMLLKIRDMRTNLLSLKKEQLSTTTRLAVLQNHQLTSELEYQSKQTEKLLFQNESLIKKVNNMQKDVQIHKQIEQELAKRSHMSKGIIKKLTNKIAELEDQLKKYKSNGGFPDSKKSSDKVEGDIAKHQQMIITLSKALQEKDRGIVKANTEAQLAESQNKMLKSKLRQNEKKSYELSVILLKYYEDIMEGKTDVRVNENEKQQFLLDIRGIKKKQISEWSNQDVRLIVVTLLNQLRHNITKHNLGIPSINRSQILLVNDDDNNDSRLPSISIPQHSLVRKDSRKFREVPTSLVPKLVGSNLREWGRTVHSNSVSNISRKFK